MLGLRRLKLDAIWLELLPGTDDVLADQSKIRNFQRQLRAHGLAGRYCLLYQKPAADTHDLDSLQCIGISKRELLERLGGPNVLLNLACSIHPPLLLKFERRIFCDLDPSENFLLDDENGSGAVVPPRILDDWTQCAWTRLPAAEISARLENILSARGYETVPATIAAAFTEIHNGRAMVLGWGGGGRRRISGSVQTICLRTLFTPSSARARGAV